jgi:hypothetical protein
MIITGGVLLCRVSFDNHLLLNAWMSSTFIRVISSHF